MPVWISAARFDELEDGKPIAVEVEGKRVLVVRRGDRVHACGGECTHYGGPLDEGLLLGTTATCPWHGARFDVADGRIETQGLC